MSYRNIGAADERLTAVLKRVLPSVSQTDMDELVECIKEMAGAMSEDGLDRHTRSGDYSDY